MLINQSLGPEATQLSVLIAAEFPGPSTVNDLQWLFNKYFFN